MRNPEQIERERRIRQNIDLGVMQRRHEVPGCNFCDEMVAKEKTFHPSHDASRRCESGKREHCSCDVCF